MYGSKSMMFPHAARENTRIPSDSPSSVPPTSQFTLNSSTLHSIIVFPQSRSPIRISPHIFSKLNERLAFSLTNPPPAFGSSSARKLNDARFKISGQIFQRLDAAIHASSIEGGGEGNQMHDVVKRRTGEYRKSKLSSVESVDLSIGGSSAISGTTMMPWSGNVENLSQREVNGSAKASLGKRKRDDSLLSKAFDNAKRKRSRDMLQENLQQNLQEHLQQNVQQNLRERLQKRYQELGQQIEVLTGDDWAEEVGDGEEFATRDGVGSGYEPEGKKEAHKLSSLELVEDDEVE